METQANSLMILIAKIFSDRPLEPEDVTKAHELTEFYMFYRMDFLHVIAGATKDGLADGSVKRLAKSLILDLLE